MKLLTSLIFGALFVFGAVSAQAQDYAKGDAAYQTGDFANALKEWQPLAEQGNANAQHNLGVMYDNGYGVVQDYAEPFLWLSGYSYLAGVTSQIRSVGKFNSTKTPGQKGYATVPGSMPCFSRINVGGHNVSC